MSNDIKKFTPFDPAKIRAMGREMVLIKRQPMEGKVGSLYIPETSRFQDRSDIADVLAVGAGIDEVKVGDRLVLPELLNISGKFTHNGDTYSVLSKEQLAQAVVVEGES